MYTQVIVVGAGPVGLLLAGELRLGGAEVVVLERLAAPTTESRASTLHARTMELLDQRGLLAALGDVPHDRMGHFGGLPLDLGHLDTRHPGQWKVPQARVEELLAGWTRRLGAQVRRRHELVGCTATDDGVRVLVDGPAGRHELSCHYLVGCDGEGSAVRRLAGIAMDGVAATRRLLRFDVAGVDVPNRRFERLPNGLAIAARRPDGVTRLMVSDAGVPPSARPGDFAEACAAWRRVTGEDVSGGTPVWVNAFDDARRLARRYRAGRVLLAGDAAHHQLPAGGQAINLGLQDAANLGWKLAAVAARGAPDALLDTYHDERHAVGARVLRDVAAQSLLLLGDAGVDAARQVLAELIGHPRVRDRLAGTISGLDVRYGDGWHPLIGARMPHLRLRGADPDGTVVDPATVVDTATVDVAAALRPGRGVLLDLTGDPARRAWLRAALAEHDLDLVSSAPAGPGPAAGLDTVLLRPDGHVAWASDRRDDPRPAARRWFARPITAAR
jgi:2-polyprenyl-6-methoxyphenol hydroxylase-like FAD-dependent oxidoreductase